MSPHGPGETGAVYAAVARLSTDLAYVEGLVDDNAHIRSTRWESYSLNGRLYVKVEGAHYEAHAWHVAIGGDAGKSSIDTHGVRRQMIVGTRVSAEVIEHPAGRDV